MSILSALQQRCNNQCELCTAVTELYAYEVPPASEDPDDTIAIC